MSRRQSLFAALLIALALSLGGCGGSDDQRAEDAIERAAEDAGEDVDVEVDGDDIKVESSDGSMSMGGDLPDGFPEDDVPLVDGEILLAMGAAGAGYQVTKNVDGSPEDALSEAISLLEGAGFAVDEEASLEGLLAATLSSDAYTVYVSATEANGTTSLIYAIEDLAG